VNSKRILVIIKLPLSVSYQYNEMERGVCGIVVQYWIVGVRYKRIYLIKKNMESLLKMPFSSFQIRNTFLFLVWIYSIHKGEKMKKQYNFSKGIKGKFYISEEEIQLPLYLDKKNQDFYTKLAKKQNRSLSEVINILLSKEKDLLSQFIP